MGLACLRGGGGAKVTDTSSWWPPGFNPMWEETLVFTVHMPEIALVRFLVWDHDPIGRDFIGQRTLAFSSMMPGGQGASGGGGGQSPGPVPPVARPPQASRGRQDRVGLSFLLRVAFCHGWAWGYRGS